MQLTRYTDYALRILVLLCAKPKGEVTTAAEIADFYGISRSHLAKVVSMLADEEIITTVRGRGGGFRLAVDPADVAIGDLVRATENLTIVECFDRETSSCPLSSDCTLERLFQDATSAFLAVLDKTTLAELVPASPELVQLAKNFS